MSVFPTMWPRLIAELIEENKISVRALAIRAGVNRQTFCKFLAGKGELRVSQMERILNALGYELEALPRGK